jgi:Tfp pilus assembly protein FimV
MVVYRRALGLEAQNLSAQLGVARNLVLLGRLAEGREVLESALPQHPQSASLRFELARVYARLQEPERAAEQTRIFQQLREKELAASDAGQSPAPP